MCYENVLILGSGQIGKEVIRRLLAYKPEVVVVHNLRETESESRV